MAASLTRAYAHFVAQNRSGPLPAVAVEVARLGFTDAVAALLAGSREPVTRVAGKAVAARHAVQESRALLGGPASSADLTAMIDACAAHALDIDDYAFANHPSAVLVPVALACGQAARADGAALVSAYVAGYEVWADLMSREPDHLHSRGWHPTALFGAIGAAASAASLLGLGEDETRNALGLAASHAGGTMGNFGSMAKAYHAGKAAQAGVFCALLAQAGMTATEDVIEGERGLLRTLSPQGRVDVKSEPELGAYRRIANLRLNIKKYPTVGASQRIIDSVLEYLQDHTVDIEALARIEPRVSEKHAAVMPFHSPSKPEEAKFSLEYATACALLHGRVGLAELSTAAVADPRLQSLIQRVQVVTTTDYDPDYPVAARFDQVTLVDVEGRSVVTPPVKRASGHADRPLTARQLRDKFLDCAAYGGINAAPASGLFDRLQALPGWSFADLAWVTSGGWRE
ncbi:MAG: MmgE/PrpD family protein [Steroidobacteraceae bacterium]